MNDSINDSIEQMKSQVIATADEQKRQAKQFVKNYNSVCLLVFIVSFWLTLSNLSLAVAVVCIACLGLMAVMKLWYWIVDAKCSVMLEVVLMRLDLAMIQQSNQTK